MDYLGTVALKSSRSDPKLDKLVRLFTTSNQSRIVPLLETQPNG